MENLKVDWKADKAMSGVLTDKFINKYRGVEAPFTELGQFVYLRTYSRWIEEQGRRETWLDTCRRVVEYNVGLSRGRFNCVSTKELREEAEFIFDNMYNLRTFPSGRSMWVGGTDVADEFGLSNFNCAFTQVQKFSDFKDIFYLLMIGAGIGIRVLKEDIEKLPEYRYEVELESEVYMPVDKYSRIEDTELKVVKDTAYLTIGDSKEGWVESLDMYFKLLYEEEFTGVKKIVVNYDNVRPQGERLVKFGGRASGYASMQKMIEKIHKVMVDGEGKIRPIHALDISNIIAENVVSGGVRRSSEMIMFDADDKEILDSKSKLYTQDSNGDWVKDESISHRSMSNNSIIFNSKPSEEELHDIFKRIRFSAEPGFINAEEARRRKPDFRGVNPCGEILLKNKECCNLTTTNLVAFVKDGGLDLEELKKVLRASVRIAIRMTLVDIELEEWAETAETDPIVGVSLTGYQDMVEAVGLNMTEQREILREMKSAVKDEAERYSAKLGIKAPELVTTVKPEGTISQLPTVSSGIHYSYSPYFIRRVRISAFDPLLKVAKELKYPVYPEVGQTEEDCDTMVVEFPVKSPAKKTANSVSALNQLENYKLFMEEWTDHNTSITVQVREEEWEEVEKWVYNNWDSVVGVTFMSLFEDYHPLLPYESIDEAEYLRRKALLQPFSSDRLSKYEEEETELDIGNDGCASGVCPIR